MHNDNEFLDLTARVGVTDEVIEVLKKEKTRLRKEEKRRVSVAKLVCNLVIEKYGNAGFQKKSRVDSSDKK